MLRLTLGLMKNSLPENLYKSFQKHEKFDIETALTKHLLGVSSYIQFSKELQNFMKVPHIKLLRNAMLGNYEIMVKLKFSLLSILRQRELTDEKIEEAFSQYGISNHSRLLEGLRLHRVYSKATTVARSIKMTLCSDAEMAQLCVEVMENIREYTSKYVWRKLAFIIKNYGEKADDLIGDLKVKALETIYVLTPFKTLEHVKNSVKRAVHNEGINKIKFHTAKRRNRMVNKGAEGFELTTVSSDHKAYKEGDQEDLNSTGSVFKSVYDPRFRQLELRMSVQSLMAKHGAQPRKRKVLELLCLKDNPHFVADVQSQYPDTARKVKSTEEVLDVIGPDKFLESIRKHVKACPVDFNIFMDHIRHAM